VTQHIFTQVGVREWSLDGSSSKTAFSVRYLMTFAVHGNFTRSSGSAELDPETIEQASIEVEID
jgi:polyisoprenoid-binding protein YceI